MTISLFPVSEAAFEVKAWGNGQIFSHSDGLGAPEGSNAHPVPLGQHYGIIHHMKRTLGTLLSITHLSQSALFSPSLFLFPPSHTLACSHWLTLWVMASVHKVLTFYHLCSSTERSTAKVMDSVSIHHPQRQNHSSSGLGRLWTVVHTGYPLIGPHSHKSVLLARPLTLICLEHIQGDEKR